MTEAAVLAAFVRKGLSVAIPFGHDDPYDLIVETNDGALLRVQCKTARATSPDTIGFNTCSTAHGAAGRRDYVGRADVFGVYWPIEHRAFVVPVAGCARYRTSLRLRPARNRQERRIRYADDFTIEQWDGSVDGLVVAPRPLAA